MADDLTIKPRIKLRIFRQRDRNSFVDKLGEVTQRAAVSAGSRETFFARLFSASKHKIPTQDAMLILKPIVLSRRVREYRGAKELIDYVKRSELGARILLNDFEQPLWKGDSTNALICAAENRRWDLVEAILKLATEEDIMDDLIRIDNAQTVDFAHDLEKTPLSPRAQRNLDQLGKRDPRRILSGLLDQYGYTYERHESLDQEATN